MITLVPIIICVLCICSSMIILGGIIIGRANDRNRNIGFDYVLYLGLCISCVCILILVIPPIFLSYSVLDFFGFI